jgi:hypothetical protein
MNHKKKRNFLQLDTMAEISNSNPFISRSEAFTTNVHSRLFCTFAHRMKNEVQSFIGIPSIAFQINTNSNSS